MTAEQIGTNALGYNPRERSWNYLEPWLGGPWRLRDIIDYQLVAWDSCLYNAALHRAELLRNFYRVGQRQIARQDPAAFVISSRQRDPGATRKLIETLRFGQVEVAQGADGSAVVSMHQPYSGWAKSLRCSKPSITRKTVCTPAGLPSWPCTMLDRQYPALAHAGWT